MEKFNLERYIEAQEHNYLIALAEVQAGVKKTHWMWYIFPQILGIAQTDISIYYSLKSKDEAIAYLNNKYLKTNLLEISYALLNHSETNIVKIFGCIDSKKLKSCMTLFAYISNENSLFQKILDKYFDGQKDNLTLNILESSK